MLDFVYVIINFGLPIFLICLSIYELVKSLGGVYYTNEEDQKEYEEWIKTHGKSTAKYAIVGIIIFLLYLTRSTIRYFIY